MTTTKLQIYNNALVEHLGERKLASLTENRKPRHVLDQIWDSNFIKGCLEDGQFNFSIRTIALSYSPSVTPSFGFKKAFDKPTDWVFTAAISSDEYFNAPLLHYTDEQQYWFCDEELIYIRYVSNDGSYGQDMSQWVESFTRFVEVNLAYRACTAITGSKTLKEQLRRDLKDLRMNAKSKSAMNQPTKFMPTGTWVSARTRGAPLRRHDRGGVVS